MTSPVRVGARRRLAVVFVGALLLTARPGAPPARQGGAPEPPAPAVDDLIRQLATPGGRVEYHGRINPGGPVFRPSAPMTELAGRGRVVQPRLFAALGDPRVRNEVALILAEVGDQDALPHLIEYLPCTDRLGPEEDFSTTCLLCALWRLTGIPLGIGSKFSPPYTPEFRTQWRAWYEANRDYLYSPPAAVGAAARWRRAPVRVDVEAKLAGRPTAAYRRDRPWVAYEEIQDWRDDPAYQRKLRDFCFSVILNPSSGGDRYTSRDTICALVQVRDPRAVAALHALCARAADAETADELLWAIKERADPAFLPFIEAAPRAADPKREADHYAPRRRYAADRIRLLTKYRAELVGKPLDPEEQMLCAECLEGRSGVDALLGLLRKQDSFLPQYLRVAGHVDREPVRAHLRLMAADEALDARTRVLAAGALARLGEPGALDRLRQALGHARSGVRLAAAEGLWRAGHRDGYRTLLGLLDVRPIESGGEGVRVGGGSLTVTALEGTNVEAVRAACTLLGEMGDPSAVGPLRRLLPLNLNGVLGGGGSGTGWPGRPDAVALARLGDLSGVEVLRASVRRGDPLDVLGSWWRGGDYAAIGLRRFIPDLLPVFEHPDEGKRVLAAREVLHLLDSGR